VLSVFAASRATCAPITFDDLLLTADLRKTSASTKLAIQELQDVPADTAYHAAELGPRGGVCARLTSLSRRSRCLQTN